jgi:ribosomal protein L12E/L44/L45/RPP1/RPP2
LPIRRIEFATAADERRRLATEARALEKAAQQAALLDFVEARLARRPAQTDVVHDVLAHLAEQMIDMNRERHAEAKGFLNWLASYAGFPIDEWRLKTIAEAYSEHGWDELLRALRENRKAIEQASGLNVESREAQEAIQGEYDKSTAKLNPLLERIAWTDRLIDLIVYRLYGLTEEEVAIVEESAAR